VKDIILQRLPSSLEIMFISMTIAIILGMKFGKIAGANKNSRKDDILRIFLYLFVSIPAFVIILYMMLLYANTPIKIFPMFGIKTVDYPDPPVITNFPLMDSLISGNFYLFFDRIWHLIVPVSAMVIIQMVIIMRQTRASMIDIMEKDYIRTARAKGFSERYIRNKHAFKNAAPPGIIASGMGFSTILGGMITVERLYLIPGLGWLFYDAIVYLDYPIIIATIFIFSIVAIIFNFVSDLIIAIIDPRIRVK
jgi:peptide/nickel transport system permease protein